MTDEIISVAPIPKRELNAFYRKVGETIAEWLRSLECPNCKDLSDLDWVLKQFSQGKPQLICRHCQKRFKIQGLRFKCVQVQPMDPFVHMVLQKRISNPSIASLDIKGENK